MILTGENWSTGRKTLYSVGGRWMNEYGAVVEWYWQGKTEVPGEKHYTAWVVDEWMSMEQWWYDTDRGKLKYWKKKACRSATLSISNPKRTDLHRNRVSAVRDRRLNAWGMASYSGLDVLIYIDMQLIYVIKQTKKPTKYPT